MSDSVSIVILAAGKGTRLKMSVPKPLAPLHNKTLIDYVVDATKGFGDLYMVTGHQSELVQRHLLEVWPKESFHFIHQKEQLGTGHAVRTYFEQTKNALDYKYTIVACADTPLLTEEVFSQLKDEINKGFDAVCASFIEQDPTGYGRIVRGDKGFKIVEHKDANDEQREIKEVNSGLYIFKTNYLNDHIFNLDSNNKAGEFYLTDTCKLGNNVNALTFKNKEVFLGVNSLEQLSLAESLLRQRIHSSLMNDGVRIIDPNNTYIYSTKIGKGCVIYPGVHIDSNCNIGEGVIIEPGCILKNSKVSDNVHLKAYSYLTDSIVHEEAKIGPMAQLRPGSDIGAGSKLGNFVEVKKSKLHSNVSVSHLSYVGDAEIHSDVNIGCGFITCNYDGAQKHKTEIGEGSFIGSDCQMVAPINIGKKVYIGSGSTINQDVPDGAFAIARQRQVIKEDMAKKFIKSKK